jgi:hypothetical protein
MCKVCLQAVFSESVSPQTPFASCDHLILARCQIIQAERRFRLPVFWGLSSNGAESSAKLSSFVDSER